MLSRAYYFPTGPPGRGEISAHKVAANPSANDRGSWNDFQKRSSGCSGKGTYSDNAVVTRRSHKNGLRNDCRVVFEENMWRVVPRGCKL